MTEISVEVIELAKQLSELGNVARKLLESPDLKKVLHEYRGTSSNYEMELIQVAAYAIAAITDLRMESDESEADVYRQIEREVYQERLRQDCRFGSMPRHLNPLIWIAVLTEELAEVAEEIRLDD